MPTVNGYNVGTDAAITIADQYGDVFPVQALGHLTDFNWASDDNLLKVTPITNGGIPVYQTIWGGVSGNMKLARINGVYQAMFVELIGAYHSGGLITQFSVSVNVLNRDGTVDEYLLTNLQFHKPSFGNFMATKEVDMSTQFSASLITVQGGASSVLTALPIAA